MTLDELHISCELLHDHTVNYAMQQNHVPLIKRLCITNDSSKDLENLTVQITTEPELSLPWETTISSIRTGQKIDLGIVDIQLSPAFLGSLSERLAARITIVVLHEETILFTNTSSIDILPYDEWSGTQSLPEIIAAFVYPNHPEVAAILHKASKYLGEWTGNPSLNGYQSKDPKRVRTQLAAIYAALQAQEIVYCVPPASFEEHGQKIRTPDIIIEQHLGTCLDLAVLFAACSEAAGLHPLIIFTKGHAFPGVWLVEESFAESLQDDVTLLNKRIVPGVDEICVVEATSLTSGNNCSFDKAVELAENELIDINKFHFFIDIHRARISQIRPLPLRTIKPYVLDPAVEVLPASQNIYQPEERDPNTLGQENSGCNTRLDQWERRLLDLSLRNTLLNFRVTSSTIPILTAELPDLEDALADGKDFQIHSRPTDWENHLRDTNIYKKRMHSDPQIQMLRAEFSQHRLRADLPEKELANRLTQLYRAARTSLEENGASTFFLTLGTLVWYETEVSEKPRYAPILLIPMEIVRKSVQTGYLIRESDDESQLNITLLEMLRQDFGINITGLNPLPTDGHGVDVQKVLNHIRQAVMNKPHWDVIEDAYLGLFSFSKFVMWHDLKARTKDLMKNKVVASLMAGSLQWEPKESSTSADLLDTIYHPKDIICPISADSSQLMAIAAAGEGRSIVLHGPPGTGKSQTITNIIAHALGQGKTVLFVAEKMAALSVVQRRLDQIGLAPFCLEVHSNKSKKKDVLDQLHNSLETARFENPHNWEQEANRLAELRKDLNSYVQALHCERRIGHSFFHGLSRLAAVNQFPHVVIFNEEQVKQITPDKLQYWENLIRQLQIAGEACGHPHGHYWKESHLTEYLPQLRVKLEEYLLKIHDQIKHWQETVTPIAEILNLGDQTKSYKDLMTMMECAKLFIATPAMTGSMVRSNDWDEVRTAVESWINHGRTRDKLRNDVFSRYSEQALLLDISGLRKLFETSKQKWLIPRLLGQSRVTKALRTAIKSGIQIKSINLENELDQLQSLQQEEAILSSASDRARDLLGRLWQEGDADWNAVADACQWTEEIRKLAAQFSGTDLAKMESLRNHWARIVNEYRDQLSPDGVLGKQFYAFIEAGEETIKTWELLSTQAVMDKNVFNNTEATDWFSYIINHVDQWTANLDMLRDWCAWSRIRVEAIEAGLLPLVTAYEQGKLTNNEVETAFIQGFYQAWSEYEISQDKALSSFSRGLFEDKINQFRELDERFAKISREEVYARLAAKLPKNTGDAAQNSEMGILQREIRKQRGHMALRTLFQKIPNVLTRLKPCLLMSPISVAQYIDAAYKPFDLIIFDEASQVPTCDAVGAIARGKEVIIVGDPKQLPPTNFFCAMNSEEDEENIALQDLESILDDCLAIGMPEERLKWHYRSQHESLIAFSNYQYYANKLYTFPSPDDLTPVVHLQMIDGFYDRGKSRQNRAEAEAVVSEVVRRLCDPELNRKSIGIVTFSQAQQRLIEDLLDEQFNRNPELERFVSPNVIEPLFVKSLENVQGDERDVILFSIGYGPDIQGRVSLNFGPLNKLGGWRRLNVAISRARQEMLVFSTLRADQIDLSKTNSKGVADLKAFLEYAEHGKQKLYAQLSNSDDAEPDSLFEELVCKALEERGHRVHLQVGCSGYRIDLAIVDPDHPGRYLLGIECDGATYHRAKTARDRDKLREAVLRQLGWEIHRVWSTDWWENPQKEIALIEDALAKAKIKTKTRDKSQIEAPVPPLSRIAKSVTMQPRPDKVQPITNAREYIVCKLPKVSMTQEEFYLDINNPIINNQILNVINIEGPISHGLLCKRIIQIWGMSKVGSRIDSRIHDLIAEMKLETTKSGTIVYYWPKQTQSKNYTYFRTHGNEKRDIEDIPPEEIKNASFEILSNQISLPEDDLIREVAKLFGFRKGAKVEIHIKNGIDHLVKSGLAKRGNDGGIVINK
jgi:very-short-patch-repair endonuclease